MSAEMASSAEVRTIHIPLLGEGTSVLRPTRGVWLGGDIYRVLPTADYDPDDEEWEFPPGTHVECQSEGGGGRAILVARKRAPVP